MSVTAAAAFFLTAATPAGPGFLPAPPIGGNPAPFSSAVRVGDTLYMSGAIGITPDGKVPEGIEAQTKQTMENIGAVLKRAGLGWNDVYKCTAFLADMKDWPAFNSVYVTYFDPARRPTRSALGVNGLALGALVEVECQAFAGGK